jgi:hypothetical protein
VLARALAGAELHGVRTNRDLLVNVLRHPAFLAGATDTAFFDTHGLDALARPLADDRAVRLSAVAAALTEAAHNRAIATVQAEIPSGWRNLASAINTRAIWTPAAGAPGGLPVHPYRRGAARRRRCDGGGGRARRAVLADAGGVARVHGGRYGADVSSIRRSARSRSPPCRAPRAGLRRGEGVTAGADARR